MHPWTRNPEKNPRWRQAAILDVANVAQMHLHICLNFGHSGANTMIGTRKFPILGALSPPLNLLKFPLEFMENLWRYSSHGPLPLCQISSLCDKHLCHLRMYVRTYLHTTLAKRGLSRW